MAPESADIQYNFKRVNIGRSKLVRLLKEREENEKKLPKKD